MHVDRLEAEKEIRKRLSKEYALAKKSFPEKAALAEKLLELVKETGWLKYALLDRAHHWYGQALPMLAGMPLSQVAEKIKKLRSQPAPPSLISARKVVDTKWTAQTGLITSLEPRRSLR